MSNDKLCKRYLFNLEMIVKDKSAANKKIEGPPRMLYLRELYTSIHQIFKEQVLAVVRSSPDGCCPHCRAAHPPTPPHPHPHRRACASAQPLAAGRYTPPRETHDRTLTCCRPARSPLHSPVYPHLTCTELPPTCTGNTRRARALPPNSPRTYPVRTNASPPSTGLTILAGARRRDLKPCWLATNAC